MQRSGRTHWPQASPRRRVRGSFTCRRTSCSTAAPPRRTPPTMDQPTMSVIRHAERGRVRSVISALLGARGRLAHGVGLLSGRPELRVHDAATHALATQRTSRRRSDRNTDFGIVGGRCGVAHRRSQRNAAGFIIGPMRAWPSWYDFACAIAEEGAARGLVPAGRDGSSGSAPPTIRPRRADRGSASSIARERSLQAGPGSAALARQTCGALL